MANLEIHTERKFKNDNDNMNMMQISISFSHNIGFTYLNNYTFPATINNELCVSCVMRFVK
uniref:Uncharacterized protein n=1 Tax=Onchocerca volvulus TaxID=6282 RepID=A0A8R1TNW4_ONCVO